MQNLRIALVQTSLIWEDITTNLSRMEALISADKSEADVYILPEMFTTGFTMNESVTEKFDSDSLTLQWLKKMAKKTDAAICGSAIMTENNDRRNRFLWVDNDQVQFYDKRHLWSYGDEHRHFKRGEEKKVINYKGWKILPQVCYDLRFPGFARNSWDEQEALYDLMIYVANWPDARVSAWDTLGKARAIENQSYVALVNRTGTDDKGLNYVGHSALVDANGEYLVSPKHNEEGVFTEELDFDKLMRFRQRFPILKDADKLKIE